MGDKIRYSDIVVNGIPKSARADSYRSAELGTYGRELVGGNDLVIDRDFDVSAQVVEVLAAFLTSQARDHRQCLR